MVSAAVFRVLLTVLGGDLQPVDNPIVTAVYSSIENPEMAPRWEDVSDRLKGLQIVGIREADEGAIAFGQNEVGSLVVFLWKTKEKPGQAIDIDSLTAQAFEVALGNVQTPEDYNTWSAERAAVRGKILEAKSQDASVLALQFSPDQVEETTASASSLVSSKPVALIFP